MKIDEKRFGWLVGKTLLTARTYRNPFTVAYGGFEIGDPAIDSRIAPWFESQFSQAEAILRQANTDFDVRQQKRWWAEALVEKYGAVPTERQWHADPLASRLTQLRAASLHDDVIHLRRKPFKSAVETYRLSGHLAFRRRTIAMKLSSLGLIAAWPV